MGLTAEYRLRCELFQSLDREMIRIYVFENCLAFIHAEDGRLPRARHICRLLSCQYQDDAARFLALPYYQPFRHQQEFLMIIALSAAMIFFWCCLSFCEKCHVDTRSSSIKPQPLHIAATGLRRDIVVVYWQVLLKSYRGFRRSDGWDIWDIYWW